MKKIQFNWKKISYTVPMWFIIVLILSLGIKEGLRNHVDKFWIELDTILVANGFFPDSLLKERGINYSKDAISRYKIVTIEKNFHPIDSVYKSLHINDTDTIPVRKMISDPFLPDWDEEKIMRFLKPLMAKRSIIISGVTGSGKSTLVDRVSKILTGNPDRILNLLCVQKMEVEFHKEWIGYRTEKGFVEGRLLKYFEKCNANPEKIFAFIIDDVDKIYPETFFGSAVWNEMDNPDYKNFIDGYDKEIIIPKNFYLISVTHSGVGNTIEFNNEHIRRLGERIPLNPDYKEFLLYIKKKQKKMHIPTEHIKKLLYFFNEANQYIKKNYDIGYTLGQWSTINKQIKPSDFEDYINSFVLHVNSFKPAKPLSRDDLDDLVDGAENNGIEPKTNFFYYAYLAMVSTGLFSEVTVALGFAIISGIFGWFFVRNKRKFIYNLEIGIIKVIDRFKDFEIDYEEALKTILEYKYNLEKLILKRKVNYEETSFLILFINDQLNKLEELNRTNLVSKEFMSTFEKYMSDGILDKKEYQTLTQFLDNLRTALTPEIYYNLKNRIDELYFKNKD